MLTQYFQHKRKKPRLHRILQIQDDSKQKQIVPEMCTDEAVRQLDHFERNAVHVAVANPHTTLETMDILLEMYPHALEEYDKGGRLPFHVAVSHQTSRQFLQYLLDYYPESMKERTKFGVRSRIFISNVTCSNRNFQLTF